MSVSAGEGQPRLPLPIEICVIDNGPARPADIVDHLFDPFVSGRREGQGLGLALVDKLVRDMSGSFNMPGKVRRNDVLRLLLPRAIHEPPIMSHVLVVDDDAAIRTVVGQALRRAGMR